MDNKNHECMICGEMINLSRLSGHMQKHKEQKMTNQEYYDKYLIKEGEGKCSSCCKPARFKSISKGYLEFCCRACSDSSETNRQKVRDGMKNKANSNGDKESYYRKRKEKSDKTKIEKHGSLDNAYSESVKKVKDTCIERYGVDSATKLDSTKQKRLDTIVVNGGMDKFVDKLKKAQVIGKIKKHGSLEEYNKHTSEAQKNGKITKYGSIENFNKIHNVKIHTQKKYCVENASHIEGVCQKKRDTCMKNFGVDHQMKDPEIRELARVNGTIAQRKINYDTLLKNIKDRGLTIVSDYDEYVNMEADLIVECNHCGEQFKWKIHSHINGSKESYKGIKLRDGYYCLKCFQDNASKEEKEVRKFIESLGVTNVEYNRRFGKEGRGNKKEIDIYLPDYNLGIEYNGIYWHSSAIVKKDYHINKLNIINDCGIELMQILSNEWVKNRPKVENRIKERLGKLDYYININDAYVNVIVKEDARKFAKENDIVDFDGHAKVFYGLYYQNELASYATFKTNNGWELINFADKLNVQIDGGLVKILNKVIDDNGSNEIVVDADQRYYNGNQLEKYGFELCSMIKPKYFYVNMCNQFKLLNNKSYEKPRLRKKKNFMFNEELTEYENMVENGYLSIYNSGYKRLKYKNS